jgi:hypothetical protein
VRLPASGSSATSSAITSGKRMQCNEICDRVWKAHAVQRDLRSRLESGCSSTRSAIASGRSKRSLRCLDRPCLSAPPVTLPTAWTLELRPGNAITVELTAGSRTGERDEFPAARGAHGRVSQWEGNDGKHASPSHELHASSVRYGTMVPAPARRPYRILLDTDIFTLTPIHTVEMLTPARHSRHRHPPRSTRHPRPRGVAQ